MQSFLKENVYYVIGESDNKIVHISPDQETAIAQAEVIQNKMDAAANKSTTGFPIGSPGWFATGGLHRKEDIPVEQYSVGCCPLIDLLNYILTGGTEGVK